MSKRDILVEMQQSDQAVHVISARRAVPLLEDQLVRRVTIQPAPRKSMIAVSITAKGRTVARLQTEQAAEAETPPSE